MHTTSTTTKDILLYLLVLATAISLGSLLISSTLSISYLNAIGLASTVLAILTAIIVKKK